LYPKDAERGKMFPRQSGSAGCGGGGIAFGVPRLLPFLLLALVVGCAEPANDPLPAARVIMVGEDFVGPDDAGAARDSAARALAIVLANEPVPPRVAALPGQTPLLLTALAASAGSVEQLALIDPPADKLPAALEDRVGEVTICRTYAVPPEAWLSEGPTGVERLTDDPAAMRKLARQLAEGGDVPGALAAEPLLWRLTRVAFVPDKPTETKVWLRLDARGERVDGEVAETWPAHLTLRPGETLRLEAVRSLDWRPDEGLPAAEVTIGDDAPPTEVRPRGARFVLRLQWERVTAVTP
jgi:hypothetical protein